MHLNEKRCVSAQRQKVGRVVIGTCTVLLSDFYLTLTAEWKIKDELSSARLKKSETSLIMSY